MKLYPSEAFFARFPSSYGALTFSRIAFNRDLTEAFFYTEHLCGLCGEGKFVYMRKTDGKWAPSRHRGRSIAEVDVSEISRLLLLQGPDHRRLADPAARGNVAQRQTFRTQLLNLRCRNRHPRPTKSLAPGTSHNNLPRSIYVIIRNISLPPHQGQRNPLRFRRSSAERTSVSTINCIVLYLPNVTPTEIM
jgi:hypothetical protein